MNVEIGTETPIFLFWEYLFRNFGILSLQCSGPLVSGPSPCQLALPGHSGVLKIAEDKLCDQLAKDRPISGQEGDKSQSCGQNTDEGQTSYLNTGGASGKLFGQLPADDKDDDGQISGDGQTCGQIGGEGQTIDQPSGKRRSSGRPTSDTSQIAGDGQTFGQPTSDSQSSADQTNAHLVDPGDQVGGEGGLTLAAVRRAEELGRLVPQAHQCNKHLKQIGKRAIVF
jgi:hypothetical protein